MEFELDSSGRKYHKIWECVAMVHALPRFHDKKTGHAPATLSLIRRLCEVYKPASYKAPAKIVRYNLKEILHPVKNVSPCADCKVEVPTFTFAKL